MANSLRPRDAGSRWVPFPRLHSLPSDPNDPCDFSWTLPRAYAPCSAAAREARRQVQRLVRYRGPDPDQVVEWPRRLAMGPASRRSIPHYS